MSRSYLDFFWGVTLDYFFSDSTLSSVLGQCYYLSSTKVALKPESRLVTPDHWPSSTSTSSEPEVGHYSSLPLGRCQGRGRASSRGWSLLIAVVEVHS